MRIKKIKLFLCAALFASILGAAAGFQVLGKSRDYDNYIAFFQSIPKGYSADLFAYRFEPGFTALTYILVNASLTDSLVYAIFATIALFIKFMALSNIKNYWAALLLLLLFYLGRYFTLFEMTVLRAAMAASIGFFVFMNRSDSLYRTTDLLLLCVAVTMHFSALIFIPIYLYTPKHRYQVIGLSIFAFGLIVAIKEAALNLLPNVFVVFTSYDEFNKATLLPIPLILDIFFLAFALYKWNYADTAMRVAVFGYSVALALHFSLLDYSVIASRFRELLSLFVLIYVVHTMDCKSHNTKVIAIAFAMLSAALHLYVGYIHDPLLT